MYEGIIIRRMSEKDLESGTQDICTCSIQEYKIRMIRKRRKRRRRSRTNDPSQELLLSEDLGK